MFLHLTSYESSLPDLFFLVLCLLPLIIALVSVYSICCFRFCRFFLCLFGLCSVAFLTICSAFFYAFRFCVMCFIWPIFRRVGVLFWLLPVGFLHFFLFIFGCLFFVSAPHSICLVFFLI